MSPKLSLFAGLIMACWLAASAGVHGQTEVYRNPYTGTSAAARQGYNPYTGTATKSASAYNPYTGKDVQEKKVYNPYTGSSAEERKVTNPYTGRSSYSYAYRRR